MLRDRAERVVVTASTMATNPAHLLCGNGMMMTGDTGVLVTGALGVVGRALVPVLRSAGHYVVATDLPDTASAAEVHADLADARQADALIGEGAFSAVVHAAAIPARDRHRHLHPAGRPQARQDPPRPQHTPPAPPAPARPPQAGEAPPPPPPPPPRHACPGQPPAASGSPPSSPASPRATGAATNSRSCCTSNLGTCSPSSANGHGWASSPAPASALTNSTPRQKAASRQSRPTLNFVALDRVATPQALLTLRVRAGKSRPRRNTLQATFETPWLIASGGLRLSARGVMG